MRSSQRNMAEQHDTLSSPPASAILPAGRSYVVDTGGSRLEQLGPSGRLLNTIGRLGTGDDGLRRPRGIAFDGQGTLFVADTANHRVQRFSAMGEPLGPWGSIGSAPGEF